MNVVTRFAPSPTGYFHAGSYRTALFAWLFARKNSGKFILRIEDTDVERSKKEYEDNIVDSLKWLGLNYDEFYRQSERTIIYKEYLQKLIASGHAYISKETSGDRASVIRFKNPNRRVDFDDLIRGRISFDTTELGDFVIAKSEDEPIFHLVNVIDDILMGMTHIIRGEDHISNTPRQILIYEALGAKPPIFAHIPLLLAADRSKLSKRNGAKPVTEYRAKGYLPEALVNYLVLLGWHPEDDKELMALHEIIERFSLERVQKGGAVFDDNKLLWFNREYISHLNDDDLLTRIKPFLPTWIKEPKKYLAILREKIHHLSEAPELFEKGELAFVKALPAYDASKLLWKKNPDKIEAKTHLNHVQKIWSTLDTDSFAPDLLKNTIWSYVEEKGKGEVLWPLRFSLTGAEKSPDPFVSAFLLGKDESLKRLTHAINIL